MRIGIIGSGHIGGTLGRHFARAGHEVMFSSRHPDELRSMAAEVGARAGRPAEAARYGDVILLAIPFGQIPDLAGQLGPLEGKILIDATNPYLERDGDVARRVIDDADLTSSAYVAQQLRGARLVKAFNSVYYEVLEREAFREGDARIAVQLAGDDEAAKEVVRRLLKDVGFAAQDLGPLDQGRHFEPGAPLYNQNLPIREAETLYARIGAE